MLYGSVLQSGSVRETPRGAGTRAVAGSRLLWSHTLQLGANPRRVENTIGLALI